MKPMRSVKTPPAEQAAPKPPKERGGIQSLERAFSIVEEVARHSDGINLVELSKSVGLHNSTTFHLVKTMVQLGYVTQLKDSKRYRIGSRLFALAAGALDENALLAAATPILERLSAATGETGHFSIRSGHELVVVARTAATGLLQLADRTGTTRPMHATALGKVLLASLPPEQLEEVLAGLEMRRYTSKTIVEREALRKQVEEARKSGVAFDDGEFDADVRCVAMPVHDFSGRVAGAIGISGPIWRLALQTLHEKAREVGAAAAELSAKLGYRHDAAAAKH
jgi:DNA-binding IclR family transcriptional regulator